MALGLGFEKFYGFIGAGDQPVEGTGLRRDQAHRAVRRESRLHFDYDIADQAIEWIRTQKAVAPTSVLPLLRAGRDALPHHPRKEWIAKYKGRFDPGWDKVREETLAMQKKLGLVRSTRTFPCAAGGSPPGTPSMPSRGSCTHT